MERSSRLIALGIVLAMVLAACSSGGGGDTNPSSSSDTVPLVTSGGSERPPYTPPHTRPGPAADLIEFVQCGIDQAVNCIRSGDIDLYLAGLRTATAKSLEGATDVQVFRAPAGSVSLILNPAEGREFNPFSDREIRWAMNALVDRPFIVNELYGSADNSALAVQQTVQVGTLDFDWRISAETVANAGIRYNKDEAIATIAERMREHGAVMKNGVWNIDGSAVTLTSIIRIEDERRSLGDTVTTALQEAGFVVSVQYQNFQAATRLVYTSDPKLLQWHIYTEGWLRSSAERYDAGAFNQYCAPWMAQMPGWQIAGYWEYQNSDLDDIGQRLFAGDFASEAERNELFRDGTKLCMEEAIRIWVATTVNSFPANPNLTGAVEDIATGPLSLLTLREAYVPGRTNLRIGSLWVHTNRSVYNPIGGYGDAYSIAIAKNLSDPMLINDPASGIPIPFRAEYEVERADAGFALSVPDDAVVWDADADRWVPVADGTTALSKVVFDLSMYVDGSVWHDGEPITMADALYGISSKFDRTNDEKKRSTEFVLAVTNKPVLDVFRGFRVIDERTIEVYMDYWHFEESYIAQYATYSGLGIGLSTPWQILAVGDELVYNAGRAAYSQGTAARTGRFWLSYAQKDHASDMNNAMGSMSRKGFVPEGVFEVNGTVYVQDADATARYAASQAFFAEHGHLVISQGPFVLDKYLPEKQYAALTAFRHEGYPFKPGDWYREPPTPVAFGDIDISAGELAVTLEGEGNLALDYLVIDPGTGAVLQSGLATRSGDAFVVVIDEAVRDAHSGEFVEVVLLASSDKIARITTTTEDVRL